jgi:hypothetical protein
LTEKIPGKINLKYQGIEGSLDAGKIGRFNVWIELA